MPPQLQFPLSKYPVEHEYHGDGFKQLERQKILNALLTTFPLKVLETVKTAISDGNFPEYSQNIPAQEPYF